jgi:hypothetical protein
MSGLSDGGLFGFAYAFLTPAAMVSNSASPAGGKCRRKMVDIFLQSIYEAVVPLPKKGMKRKSALCLRSFSQSRTLAASEFHSLGHFLVVIPPAAFSWNRALTMRAFQAPPKENTFGLAGKNPKVLAQNR